jgi:hypothetical protein
MISILLSFFFPKNGTKTEQKQGKTPNMQKYKTLIIK